MASQELDETIVQGSADEATRGDGGAKALSVSQALMLAKASLQQIRVSILGEVSEVSNKPGYKAVYFTLADEQSALPCLMWKSNLEHTRLELKQGMLVEATGVFSVYAAKGRLNFEVRSLRLAGEGALRMRVAQLAAQLESQGLMDPDRKLPIPRMPARIGLVTSPRGKAVHDVLRTLRRRFPLAEVVLAGVPVEGPQAAESMIAGLNAAMCADVEVIVLVRGGGSYEDMMPFNDEALARAIAACPVPVVTGIGHEPDNSIADMVASARASTPTAAAELVSPDCSELKVQLALQARQMLRNEQASLSRRAHVLAQMETRPVLTDPRHYLQRRTLLLEMAQMRLLTALDGRVESKEQRYKKNIANLQLCANTIFSIHEHFLGIQAAKLESLSPLAVLARGYALARDEKGRIVSSVDAVDLGAHIDLRLTDGFLACLVEGYTKDEKGLRNEHH